MVEILCSRCERREDEDILFFEFANDQKEGWHEEAVGCNPCQGVTDTDSEESCYWDKEEADQAAGKQFADTWANAEFGFAHTLQGVAEYGKNT